MSASGTSSTVHFSLRLATTLSGIRLAAADCGEVTVGVHGERTAGFFNDSGSFPSFSSITTVGRGLGEGGGVNIIEASAQRSPSSKVFPRNQSGKRA
jgi:hypothetical protein